MNTVNSVHLLFQLNNLDQENHSFNQLTGYLFCMRWRQMFAFDLSWAIWGVFFLTQAISRGLFWTRVIGNGQFISILFPFALDLTRPIGNVHFFSILFPLPLDLTRAMGKGLWTRAMGKVQLFSTSIGRNTGHWGTFLQHGPWGRSFEHGPWGRCSCFPFPLDLTRVIGELFCNTGHGEGALNTGHGKGAVVLHFHWT